jgi:hypothetical protein
VFASLSLFLGEEPAEAEPAAAAALPGRRLAGGFPRRGGPALHLVQDGVRLQQLLLLVQRAEDGVEQALLLRLRRRSRDRLRRGGDGARGGRVRRAAAQAPAGRRRRGRRDRAEAH